MRIIITETQQNSLKSSLNRLKKESGIGPAIKAVGGVENYIRILYDGNVHEMLKELFDPIFDRLKMKRRYHNWYAFDWVKDGSIVIQRDNNGTLFIFGPEEYNEIAKIKKLMEPTESFFVDIKEALSMYLNKRYEEEFEGHPIIINHI
jgi:hypothetical protein